MVKFAAPLLSVNFAAPEGHYVFGQIRNSALLSDKTGGGRFMR